MIILQADTGHIIHINDNISLECLHPRWNHYIPGSTQPNLVYNGDKVSPSYNDRFSISRGENASRLTIVGAQFNDSGIYKCYGPEGTKQFQVTVVGEDRLQIRKFICTMNAESAERAPFSQFRATSSACKWFWIRHVIDTTNATTTKTQNKISICLQLVVCQNWMSLILIVLPLCA